MFLIPIRSLSRVSDPTLGVGGDDGKIKSSRFKSDGRLLRASVAFLNYYEGGSFAD